MFIEGVAFELAVPLHLSEHDKPLDQLAHISINIESCDCDNVSITVLVDARLFGFTINTTH